jgi:hypothetical protein
MVTSSAATPDDYLRELPPARAADLSVVRDAVNAALPFGYVEEMGFGMISWVVPLEVCPDTYNTKPLMFAALAAQKNYSSLYLMSVYADSPTAGLLQERWTAPKKLSMGKSCIRFSAAADLDLPLIGEILAACPMDEFVERAKQSRTR